MNPVILRGGWMRFFNSTKEEPTGIIRLITSFFLSLIVSPLFLRNPYYCKCFLGSVPQNRGGRISHVYLRTDGFLGAWGDNSTVNKLSPVQIGTDTTWAWVSGGGSHTAGVKTNGTLWAWGYNAAGQLGDATTTSKSAPGHLQLRISFCKTEINYHDKRFIEQSQ